MKARAAKRLPLVGMNAKRAVWAKKAVDAFAAATRVGDEDMETQISDLIDDLRHLCDAHGVVFERVLDRANANYREETHDGCKKCGRTFDSASEDDPCNEDLCPECFETAGGG